MSLNIDQIRQLLIDVMHTHRKEEINRYRSVLLNIITKTNEHPIEALKVFIEAIVKENVFLETSQSLLSDICSHNLLGIPDADGKILAHFILDKIKSRVISFEDQDCTVRQYLASIYDKENNWREAASVLSGIRLEIGQKKHLKDYKLNIYLQIVRLYLEADEPTMAVPFINRASLLQIETKNIDLQNTFKECYASLLDHKCMFIEAAQWYYDLSNWKSIPEENYIMAVKNTFICTILSSVGKQRSNMVTKLYEEERYKSLPGFLLLKKMNLVQLIRPNEIALLELDAMLKPHQKIKTKFGLTFLDQAIAEHNLLAVQKLYKNIKIAELGLLLGIEPFKAEKIVANMISEGHINGLIDQINYCVLFKKEHCNLQVLDKEIEGICNNVNYIIELISKDTISCKLMNKQISKRE